MIKSLILLADRNAEAEAISHTRNHGLRNSRAEPSWLELDPPRIAPWHGQLSTRRAAACDFFPEL